ncbi:helix-turn-helix domain-containing protein [Alkalihalobacillus macyae]|uniref:helix-turn-helix domain-containing protein n=1 Tax=Guptibacillus hwajinpoensis TaxID=208199 RepID=UPI00273A75B7|nr:helix-turn-helix domain-containing protein [Alkalihalobacillus macyae]MDP4552663.1 helix-turn-helix domain-containing protein [Alkalihalobacillus macyae]
MEYINGVVLFVLNRYKGERSISAVYHLLRGKKSSQTIQDARLFDVSFLFGMLKHLNRNQLQDVTVNLVNEGSLLQTDQDRYVITQDGNSALQTFVSTNPFPMHLNGWKYHHLADQFWQRLSLYVQSLSYSVHNNMNFYPVMKDELIQGWVRNHFPTRSEDRVKIAAELYQEVTHVLEKQPNYLATFFVHRLSGVGRTGLTLQQTATEFRITLEEATIKFYGVIHACLTFIQTSSDYPLLASLAADEHAELPLTSSTRQTYELLMKGLTMDQIVNKRQLKKSTIEDHLVEIAINVPDFSIDPFVTRQAQQSIKTASQETKSQRLKTIKEHLNHKYPYFEIRLTLCKEGVQ